MNQAFYAEQSHRIRFFWGDWQLLKVVQFFSLLSAFWAYHQIFLVTFVSLTPPVSRPVGFAATTSEK